MYVLNENNCMNKTMKKLLIWLALQMNIIPMDAQYIKLPLDTNHYWNEYCQSIPITGGPISYKLRVKMDSVVNGIQYKLLYADGSSCLQNFYPILLRQDTILKRVIILVNNQEKILYNFDKNVGDTAQLFCVSGVITATLTYKDSVLLNDGIFHKRYNFGGAGPGKIIEGVGSNTGLLFPVCNTFNTSRSLICLVKNSAATTIYSNSQSSLSCSIPTEVNSYDIQSGPFYIFPNPSADKLTISTDNWFPETIEFINCIGESVLLIRDWKENGGVLDISSLPSGIYIVRCKADLQVKNRLLIKN